MGQPNRRSAGFLAGLTAIALAIIDYLGRTQAVEAIVPPTVSKYLPLVYVGGFAGSLLLLRAQPRKRAQVVLEGSFDRPSQTENGVFATNVGDLAAVEIQIQSIGSADRGAMFDRMAVLKPGDRAEVRVRYAGQRDMFDVISFLETRAIVGDRRQEWREAAAEGEMPSRPQRRPPYSVPLTVKYRDTDGGSYVDSGFEIATLLGPAPVDGRLEIRHVAARTRA